MYAPLTIFAVELLLGILLSSHKQFEDTPSEGHNFASTATWPLLLLLLMLSSAFFCCIHMYAQIIAKAMKSPTFPVNAVFFGFFIFNIFAIIYDHEVSREMEAGASFGHLEAYIFRVPKLYKSKVIDNGVKVRNRTMEVLIDTMSRSAVHWVLLVCFTVGAAGVFVLLCVVTYKKWRSAFQIRGNEETIEADIIDEEFAEEDGHDLPRFGSHEKGKKSSSISYLHEEHVQYTILEQRKLGQHVLLTVFTVLALIDVILFFVTATASISPIALAEAAPGNWNLWMSLSDYKMPESRIETLIERERADNKLPDGLYYIDQRKNVEFPYIVGDHNVFCEFNDCNKRELMEFKEAEANEKSLANLKPNVIMIIVESFCPNPILLKDPYNHIPFNQGEPFDEVKIPNIARLAVRGQTEETVSSLGLPTIFGWHSLMTGHEPLIRGINMAEEYKNNWLSLAEFFEMHGYATSYNSPSPPEFDGKHNYLYRGTDYDYVNYGFPIKGDRLPDPNSWVSDRLTEEQFEEQLTKLYDANKPFFATWMTVDMHTPFHGYDNPVFYDESVEDDYERVTKYTDSYIGKLLDFLETHDNNTVVILVGDHGARERPLASRIPTLLNQSCTEKVFSDGYFLTSGVTAYFGDNELIKERFPQNTTVINSTDSNSFILELEYLIGELSDIPFITNRFPSRVSNAHRVIEYRAHGKIYRSFTYSRMNSEELASLPSCLAPKQGMTKDLLLEARELIGVRNALQAGNRMWNPGFICNEANCPLPSLSGSTFVTGWALFGSIFAVLLVLGIITGWVITLIVWRLQRPAELKNQTESE